MEHRIWGCLGGVATVSAALALGTAISLAQTTGTDAGEDVPRGDSTIWVIKPQVTVREEAPGAAAASPEAEGAEPEVAAVVAEPEVEPAGDAVTADASPEAESAEPEAAEVAVEPEAEPAGDAATADASAEAEGAEPEAVEAAAEPEVEPAADAATAQNEPTAEAGAQKATADESAAEAGNDATAEEARAAVEPAPDEGVGERGPVEPEESAILPSAEDQKETQAQTMAIDCVKRPEGCITPLDNVVEGPVLSSPGGDGIGFQVIARPAEP